MAKKKKSALKPVVSRGFATTSMPSKNANTGSGGTNSATTTPPNGLSTPVSELTRSNVDAALDSNADTLLAGVAKLSQSENEFDAAREEEQALQNVVNRLRDRVDKDVARFWKAIEFDRRLSKQLPIFEMDKKVQEQVLTLETGSALPELETNDVTDDAAGAFLAHVQPSSAANELLHKSLVTHALLLRLGFTHGQATAALAACKSTTDVDECVAWLAGALDMDALDAADRRCEGKITGEEEEAAAAQGVDETRPPIHDGFVFERAPVASRSAGISGTSTPVVTGLASQNGGSHTPVALSKAAKEAVENATQLAASLLRTLDDQEQIDTLEAPDTAYAQARLFNIQADKMSSALERHGRGVGSSDASFGEARRKLGGVKARARSVIDDCQASPSWNKSKAENVFQRLKMQWEDAEQAKEALNGGQGNEQDDSASDAADEADDDLQDGQGDLAEESLFGDLLDEQAKEVVDEATKVSVTLRDLPTPALKAQGSKAPRTLLNDALRRRDPSATVRYEVVATGGRMHRSRLTMRWQKGFVDTFTMTGMATLSQTSADDLMALVALMCVDDRAADRVTASGFREWWDEVAERKQQERDAVSRGHFAAIMAVLGPRLEEANRDAEETKRMLREKAAVAQQPQKTATPSSGPEQGNGHGDAVRRDEAGQRLWEARQQSKAFLDMLPGRQGLPIAAFKKHFLDILEDNQVVVLSGETGCGKSTQIPSYIIEHRLQHGLQCKVYVTEPRRISAISLAERVSSELGEPRGFVGKHDSLIGSAVRLENNIGRNARLVFATTGIVLRMLEGGQLEGVTHIIVDEVHERSIESDFLLIILKSLMLSRPDLKVVLMSATLDAERISAYFGGCPTVSVPGRTFPVEVQYLEDAVELCDYTLEDGSPYMRRNRRARHADVNNKARLAVASADDDEVDDDEDGEQDEQRSKVTGRYKPKTVSTLDRMDENVVNHELIVSLLERTCFGAADLQRYSAATLIFLPGIADIRKLHDILQSHRHFGTRDFQIWPLHSTITSENQALVFEVPRRGVRKIVLSTNIAETGITIPDITCVIDSGKHREMRFDEKRQMSKLVECFVSRSNAKQRRGRAGRVQEGLCWHLFTRFRHDNFLAEHPIPEILRLSLQDLALKLKVMKVRIGTSIEDALSKALDAPASINIQRSVASLVEIKALTTTEDITALGRQLSRLPLDVHMAKFLLVACTLRVLDSALTIAATLNAKSPFLVPFGRELEARAAKKSFNAGDSDFVAMVRAFNAWRRASDNGVARQFCQKCFLSSTNLVQIEELRQQYMTYLLDAGFVQVDDKTRRELVGARFRFHAGKPRFMRVPDELNEHGGSLAQVNAALVASLYPKLLTIDASGSSPLKTLTNNAPAAVHPSSVNFHLRFDSLARGLRHMVYFTIMQSRRLYAWETAVVDDKAVLLLCGDADFKFASKSLYIDRQRVRVTFYDVKTTLALRRIRQWLVKFLQASYRTPGKAWSDEDQRMFALTCAFLGVAGNDKDRVVM